MILIRVQLIINLMREDVGVRFKKHLIFMRKLLCFILLRDELFWLSLLNLLKLLLIKQCLALYLFV